MGVYRRATASMEAGVETSGQFPLSIGEDIQRCPRGGGCGGLWGKTGGLVQVSGMVYQRDAGMCSGWPTWSKKFRRGTATSTCRLLGDWTQWQQQHLECGRKGTGGSGHLQSPSSSGTGRLQPDEPVAENTGRLGDIGVRGHQ